MPQNVHDSWEKEPDFPTWTEFASGDRCLRFREESGRKKENPCQHFWAINVSEKLMTVPQPGANCWALAPSLRVRPGGVLGPPKIHTNFFFSEKITHFERSIHHNSLPDVSVKLDSATERGWTLTTASEVYFCSFWEARLGRTSLSMTCRAVTHLRCSPLEPSARTYTHARALVRSQWVSLFFTISEPFCFALMGAGAFYFEGFWCVSGNCRVNGIIDWRVWLSLLRSH